MRSQIAHEARAILTRNRYRRIWMKIVSVLGCLVVFCTTYALILPAITLEENQCGKMEHTHTDACYAQVLPESKPICTGEGLGLHAHTDACLDASGAYCCGNSDFVIHTHDAVCFDADGNLWCPLPEATAHVHSDACYATPITEEPPHIHTEDCYAPQQGALICAEDHPHEATCYETEQVLVCALPTESESTPERICGQEEMILHTHDAACYDATGNPICGKPQVLEHAHNADCFEITSEAAAPETLTCEIPEGEGAHTHGEGCYDEGGLLICQLEESEGHLHGARCYGIWELTCGLEEHTHNPACYADPTADVETAEDWEQTFADVELTGVWAEDVLAIAESQLGYTESTANYVVEPDGTLKGYTRYGAWCGSPYGDWCAMFVSFCLNYAGVPEDAFPWEASCPRWVEKLEEMELYAPAVGEYRPGLGDVVFFDWDGDTQADHVGLVRELRGETGFATIEGNCGNQVAMREYAGNDTSILGYGILSAFRQAAPLSEEGVDWGYNPDDSIWWKDSTITQINDAADIRADVPYVIAGRNRVNVMTKDKASDTVLATARPAVSSFVDYEIWYFEADGENFRIYYLDESNAKHYLQLNQADLTLVTEVEQASSFSVAVTTSTEFSGMLIKCGEYYLNTYGSDWQTCSGWAGWNQPDSGSHLQILEADTQERTAQRIITESSPNTVINLFDYWLTERFAPDNDSTTGDLLVSGINNNHAFKFVKDENDGNHINTYLHEHVNTGIVANRLGSDGYPYLSGDLETQGTDSTESLAYLFNPKIESEGKHSYRNVGGLLTIDEQGYYSFNCKTQSAEFREDKNNIYVYDAPVAEGAYTGVGQFFPFDKAPRIGDMSCRDVSLNHYFGLTITTRFIQQHGGHTNIDRKVVTTFDFTGDDDVWIFIDGVLVGDVGGVHDACSVSINFKTGAVVVKNRYGGVEHSTTLKAAYEAANAVEKTDWNGDTFKDNTTHTLKFYYLERGNVASNLTLKYNLTKIPDTTIYKVNQYGGPVKDATFAVYAADEAYNMLSEKNGQIVTVDGKPQYDDDGNIVDASGNILAHALYKSTTNAQGEMLFADPDGMAYSLKELEDMFGSHFILREIKVPKGYRSVSKDVNLEIWHGENQTILKCNNTTDSGSRAAATLQITATDILHLQESYNGNSIVEYCSENGVTNGTLFAVVFKYIGKVDAAGNATELNDSSKWAPVYGTDREGYHQVDMAGKSIDDGILEAVRNAKSYDDIVFQLSANSTMQLTIENLPGHITTYYRMLGQDRMGETRYSVSYYWTPGSIEEISADNMFRVYTAGETASDEDPYSPFDRIFGANIQVPNLLNNVVVQKTDEKGQRIDGATFAIYPVEQQSDGTIHYRAEDGSYVALGENVTVNTDGTITDGVTTITPLDIGVTRTWEDGIHTGSTGFFNLEDGQYIIKEVAPPPGYRLNTADVMVLVTEDTIYANAGTEDDGISVGRGPGYVVHTLEKFASRGEIDNTLCWIYAQLRISEPSTSFADVGDESKISGYLTADNSCATSKNVEDAAKAYLRYEITEGEAAFNFVPNKERTKVLPDAHATGTRRLFTTVGWPYYEIYQDHAYGEIAKVSTANYDDWSSHNIANLFSRSTYIRVTDIQEAELEVKKVSATNLSLGLPGAEFRLYCQAEGQEPVYYCRNGETVTWETDAAKALVLTTGTDGLTTERFTKLSDGIYYLEEIKAPDGYMLPERPVKVEIRYAQITLLSPDPPNGHAVASRLQEDNTYIHTVTVPNSNGYLLPATGGMGTRVYTTGGLLCLCAGVLLLCYRKKRGVA